MGNGIDLSIRELVEQVEAVVGFNGSIDFRPEQTGWHPEEQLDVSRLAAMAGGLTKPAMGCQWPTRISNHFAGTLRG